MPNSAIHPEERLLTGYYGQGLVGVSEAGEHAKEEHRLQQERHVQPMPNAEGDPDYMHFKNSLPSSSATLSNETHERATDEAVHALTSLSESCVPEKQSGPAAPSKSPIPFSIKEGSTAKDLTPDDESRNIYLPPLSNSSRQSPSAFYQHHSTASSSPTVTSSTLSLTTSSSHGSNTTRDMRDLSDLAAASLLAPIPGATRLPPLQSTISSSIGPRQSPPARLQSPKMLSGSHDQSPAETFLAARDSGYTRQDSSLASAYAPAAPSQHAGDMAGHWQRTTNPVPFASLHHHHYQQQQHQQHHHQPMTPAPASTPSHVSMKRSSFDEIRPPFHTGYGSEGIDHPSHHHSLASHQRPILTLDTHYKPKRKNSKRAMSTGNALSSAAFGAPPPNALPIDPSTIHNKDAEDNELMLSDRGLLLKTQIPKKGRPITKHTSVAASAATARIITSSLATNAGSTPSGVSAPAASSVDRSTFAHAATGPSTLMHGRPRLYPTGNPYIKSSTPAVSQQQQQQQQQQQNSFMAHQPVRRRPGRPPLSASLSSPTLTKRDSSSSFSKTSYYGDAPPTPVSQATSIARIRPSSFQALALGRPPLSPKLYPPSRPSFDFAVRPPPPPAHRPTNAAGTGTVTTSPQELYHHGSGSMQESLYNRNHSYHSSAEEHPPSSTGTGDDHKLPSTSYRGTSTPQVEDKNSPVASIFAEGHPTNLNNDRRIYLRESADSSGGGGYPYQPRCPPQQRSFDVGKGTNDHFTDSQTYQGPPPPPPPNHHSSYSPSLSSSPVLHNHGRSGAGGGAGPKSLTHLHSRSLDSLAAYQTPQLISPPQGHSVQPTQEQLPPQHPPQSDSQQYHHDNMDESRHASTVSSLRTSKSTCSLAPLSHRTSPDQHPDGAYPPTSSSYWERATVPASDSGYGPEWETPSYDSRRTTWPDPSMAQKEQMQQQHHSPRSSMFVHDESPHRLPPVSTPTTLPSNPSWEHGSGGGIQNGSSYSKGFQGSEPTSNASPSSSAFPMMHRRRSSISSTSSTNASALSAKPSHSNNSGSSSSKRHDTKPYYPPILLRPVSMPSLHHYAYNANGGASAGADSNGGSSHHYPPGQPQEQQGHSSHDYSSGDSGRQRGLNNMTGHRHRGLDTSDHMPPPPPGQPLFLAYRASSPSAPSPPPSSSTQQQHSSSVTAVPLSSSPPPLSATSTSSAISMQTEMTASTSVSGCSSYSSLDSNAIAGSASGGAAAANTMTSRKRKSGEVEGGGLSRSLSITSLGGGSNRSITTTASTTSGFMGQNDFSHHHRHEDSGEEAGDGGHVDQPQHQYHQKYRHHAYQGRFGDENFPATDGDFRNIEEDETRSGYGHGGVSPSAPGPRKKATYHRHSLSQPALTLHHQDGLSDYPPDQVHAPSQYSYPQHHHLSTPSSSETQYSSYKSYPHAHHYHRQQQQQEPQQQHMPTGDHSYRSTLAYPPSSAARSHLPHHG
ncbi:hypothetical protein BGW42_008402 [Actinomortierella wolfii]|nr:hypothetical protein BGW42_008402 [Actinomortierella wolfii]